ncbi:MAG TPA: DUF4252 domain-containing protein [Thermoanaerobaculia bacterium]|nr:DUF4252 domain-containing protein [Thermoanaerobaculia bacterium]
MRKILIPGLALTLFLGGTALQALQAQKPPAAQPGFVPLNELNLFPSDKLSVEINLDGALMHLIAAATKDDQDFSQVMAGLRSLNVQVFPLKGSDADSIKAKIGRAVHWLEERGWTPNVRVREKGGETYIYMKEDGGQIVGLTVLSYQLGDEATAINIVGRIDPAQLGRVGHNLHVPQLEKLPAKGKKPQ